MVAAHSPAGVAMDEFSPYPPIDPTTFDLIIVGTGLPESIIAAAASSAGKSVLHLDPNSFYGSHFSSLSLQETVSFLQFHSTAKSAATDSHISADSEYTAIDLSLRPLISDPEVSAITPELEYCGRFGVDVSGPRVLFCADSAVNLMVKSGISEYLEFKSVDASFVYDGSGGLSRVPGSRAEIFKDRSLGLTEKTQLMRFFKLVQEHLESAGLDGVEARQIGERNKYTISKDDMERPFTEFLAGKRLPSKIKSIILYAIAMADNDQEGDTCKPLLKTDEAMRRLALYHSSISRYPNASSGMLYPLYGHGEVAQAFCRRAAVKGSIYVLRMPVVSVLVDKDSGLYKGIKLASGQQLFSHQLVLDPCFIIPQSLHKGAPQSPNEHLEDHSFLEGKVARGICITRKSIKTEGSNLLVVYPPRSLYPEQANSVRVLQIGSSLAVCPTDMFVLYLSTPCDSAHDGKKSLKAAIDALFVTHDEKNTDSSTDESPEDRSTVKNDTEDPKPTLIWSATYIQEVLKGSHQSIILAPSPDADLSYNNLVDASLKLFQEMYPDLEVFPETAQSNNSEDDDDDDDEPTIVHTITTSDNSMEQVRPPDELSTESS